MRAAGGGPRCRTTVTHWERVQNLTLAFSTPQPPSLFPFTFNLCAKLFCTISIVSEGVKNIWSTRGLDCAAAFQLDTLPASRSLGRSVGLRRVVSKSCEFLGARLASLGMDLQWLFVPQNMWLFYICRVVPASADFCLSAASYYKLVSTLRKVGMAVACFVFPTVKSLCLPRRGNVFIGSLCLAPSFFFLREAVSALAVATCGVGDCQQFHLNEWLLDETCLESHAFSNEGCWFIFLCIYFLAALMLFFFFRLVYLPFQPLPNCIMWLVISK